MNDVFLNSDEEVENYNKEYIQALINNIENKIYKMNKNEILSVINILKPITYYINNNTVEYHVFINTINMINNSLYNELKFKDSIYQINSQFKKFGFLKSRYRTYSV